VVRSKKLLGAACLVLVSGIVASCNLGANVAPTQDTGMIQTQAVGLVATQFSMQLSQTAVAASPTPLPSFNPPPTATLATAGTPFVLGTSQLAFTPLASPAATSADPCHQSAFVADITIPDGTIFRPGRQFNKRWQIQNTGTCIWDDGYRLKYLGGVLKGEDVPIDQTLEFVEPGEIQEYMVDLVSPTEEGVYEECWRMQDDGGYYFGTYLCVKILVD
jgi:hypothetical protein